VAEMLNNLISKKHIYIMPRVVLVINIMIISSNSKVYCEQCYQGWERHLWKNTQCQNVNAQGQSAYIQSNSIT